ncbi:MAG: radical SAM protein, partial [Clostridia bacterium]
LLINENNIDLFKRYFDSVSISIDGVDEESCKIIRGSNVFNKILEKIQLLKSHDFNEISLSAVLPNNYQLIEEFNKLNKDDKRLLYMRYIKRMTVDEIAVFYDYSRRTAYRRLEPALKRFSLSLSASKYDNEWFVRKFCNQKWIRNIFVSFGGVFCVSKQIVPTIKERIETTRLNYCGQSKQSCILNNYLAPSDTITEIYQST